MVALGEDAFSYERGTPVREVHGLCWARARERRHHTLSDDVDPACLASNSECGSTTKHEKCFDCRLTHLLQDASERGKDCLLNRKHDHFTPTREIRRHVRALDRNHPEGWKLQGHVSPATTNYLTYRIQGYLAHKKQPPPTGPP